MTYKYRSAFVHLNVHNSNVGVVVELGREVPRAGGGKIQLLQKIKKSFVKRVAGRFVNYPAIRQSTAILFFGYYNTFINLIIIEGTNHTPPVKRYRYRFFQLSSFEVSDEVFSYHLVLEHSIE